MLVVPSINRETGGPAKSNLSLATDLNRLGHHVEIFSTDWPAAQAEEEKVIEQDGVTIRLFPATNIPGLGHVPYSRGLIRAVRSEMGRFDFFHVASLWNPLVSHTIKILRRRRVPYAVTAHGMMDPVVFARNRILKSLWAWLWERSNVEGATLVIFNSRREEAKAKSKGWRMRRTLVVPHSINLSAGLNLPPRNQLEQSYPSLIGKTVVAFIGRVNWVKNIDLLIAAIAHLRKQGLNVALVCAGPDSDDYQKVLESLAIELGVREHILFTGMLEDAELQAVFARADVAALISKKENFGLSAAEALGAGIPVVLSDGVDMGENWTAPPVWRVEQDERAIAAGISAALDCSQKTGLPGQLARELACREFDVKNHVQLAQTLESISIAHRASHDAMGEPAKRPLKSAPVK